MTLPKFKSWEEFYMHFEAEMQKEPVPGYTHSDILFHIYQKYFREQVMQEQIPLDEEQFLDRVNGELRKYLNCISCEDDTKCVVSN